MPILASGVLLHKNKISSNVYVDSIGCPSRHLSISHGFGLIWVLKQVEGVFVCLWLWKLFRDSLSFGGRGNRCTPITGNKIVCRHKNYGLYLKAHFLSAHPEPMSWIKFCKLLHKMFKGCWDLVTLETLYWLICCFMFDLWSFVWSVFCILRINGELYLSNSNYELKSETEQTGVSKKANSKYMTGIDKISV